MLQMKSHIVVMSALLFAPAARSQSLEVSYQQKHAAVQLHEMAHTNVSAKGHDNVSHTFSCVPMKTVLATVQAPTGENLGGAGVSLVLLASARDNYHAAFTLAELDESIGDKPVFVCDKQDGESLSASDGPVRLVVPSDKRPARWVRMLTNLEIQPAQSSVSR
jgi:hypothetical protein